MRHSKKLRCLCMQSKAGCNGIWKNNNNDHETKSLANVLIDFLLVLDICSNLV